MKTDDVKTRRCENRPMCRIITEWDVLRLHIILRNFVNNCNVNFEYSFVQLNYSSHVILMAGNPGSPHRLLIIWTCKRLLTFLKFREIRSEACHLIQFIQFRTTTANYGIKFGNTKCAQCFQYVFPATPHPF